VKICCIASQAEARAAVAAGADALGLVGAMPSGPGPISDEVAAEIAAAAPPPVSAWLLSSEPDGEAVAAHARRVGVATVQVVRHLDPGEHARIRRQAPGLKIVQVIHVENEGALELARAYADTADALLLDSGRPSADELGGTGRAHDWDLSRRIVEAVDRPVFLAGGLTAENAADAITRVRPFGLDLCSGVRTGGALDAAKLAAFMAAVRASAGSAAA
jgi:phosphoribosylanthranilate isomerase